MPATSNTCITPTTCWKNTGLIAPSQRVAMAPSRYGRGIAATSAAISGSRTRTVSRSKKSSKAVAARQQTKVTTTSGTTAQTHPVGRCCSSSHPAGE